MVHALILALAFAVPTYGPIPTPSGSPPVPAARIPTAADEALIVNSGSTNTAGYRLRVYADGTTALQQADAAVRKHVPLALVKRFFADLRAAGALDKLPRAACMKSASFGSSTQVAYRGKMSPDLTCPSASPAERALAVDADALAAAGGVTMLLRPLRAP
jgi:hypothetical protein